MNFQVGMDELVNIIGVKEIQIQKLQQRVQQLTAEVEALKAKAGDAHPPAAP